MLSLITTVHPDIYLTYLGPKCVVINYLWNIGIVTCYAHYYLGQYLFAYLLIGTDHSQYCHLEVEGAKICQCTVVKNYWHWEVAKDNWLSVKLICYQDNFSSEQSND